VPCASLGLRLTLSAAYSFKCADGRLRCVLRSWVDLTAWGRLAVPHDRDGDVIRPPGGEPSLMRRLMLTTAPAPGTALSGSPPLSGGAPARSRVNCA
jgi:hypothetical protein